MNNKVALITGASSGIGRATAKLFASSGWTVVAVGRNEQDLQSLREECLEFGGTIKVQLADVLENTQIDRVVSGTIQTFGQIDVLVNSAGVIKSGSISELSIDDFDRMMNINVRSVLNLIQKCIPHLESTKGNIVNVSSVTGTRAFPGLLSYCVSKSAIDQLTRCAALDLAPKGIRVNAVNPGVVITNLHRRGGMSEEDYQKFVQHASATHPIGRAGEPEDVAALIHFLASDEAGWITGVTYAIDGGRSQTCAR